MSRRDWRGVKWPRVLNGVCTRHKTRVGTFTGVCHACHREQIAAAQRGSNEFERTQP